MAEKSGARLAKSQVSVLPLISQPATVGAIAQRRRRGGCLRRGGGGLLWRDH